MSELASASALDWSDVGPDAAPPSLDELRVALRPPELPLPAPRTALEAAERIHDLLNADRLAHARALGQRFSDPSAPPVQQLALARARLRCAQATGHGEDFEAAAAQMVSIQRRAGHREHAAATGIVLSRLAPSAVQARRASAQSTNAQGANARSGDAERAVRRHRGARDDVSAQMLAVVRGIAVPPPGVMVDPRAEAAVLREALAALPEVGDRLLGCPRTLLGLRLAQMLEGAGDVEGAVSAALDVLEATAAGHGAEIAAGLGEEPRGGAGAEPVAEAAVETGAEALDPERAATGAHAVLARALRTTSPVLAARHAVEALTALRRVDDPPLRLGLITDLLSALLSAELPDRASFTAGRLISLQRTLPRESQRIAPLLAVAAQRIDAERYDAAWVPLQQAREIARAHRDRRAAMEGSRLAASIHERTGDREGSVRELRRLAEDAHWLCDDLATPQWERGGLVRAELDAQALVMRRCLDAGDAPGAEAASEIILRRTGEGGRPVLPAPLIWDHRVDAQVGLFLAAGIQRARAESAQREAARAAQAVGGSAESESSAAGAECESGAAEPSGVESVRAAKDAYELRRRAAMAEIDRMPVGHDARARYWAAYVDDRHAAMLAEAGHTGAALRVARRVRRAWESLEQDTSEDVARTDELIARLEDGAAG